MKSRPKNGSMSSKGADIALRIIKKTCRFVRVAWHVPELAKGVVNRETTPSGTVRSMIGSGTCHPSQGKYPFSLLSLFDLGPSIAQRHGAVEDQFAWRGVRIDGEIAQALELEAIANLGRREARLETTAA